MKAPENRRKTRIVWLGGLFFLLFCILTGKAVYLQVFQSSWLARMAEGEYEKSQEHLGKRGTIYDSRGREMAVTLDATSVGAYPKKILDFKSAAEDLSACLGVDSGILYRNLDSHRPFIWIKRQVTPREAEAVRDLALEGIDFIPEQNRFYPNRMLAAQLIGFTGIDGRGLEGLEYLYDTYLKGKAGNYRMLTDALGRGFDGERLDLPEYSGNSLILTIDAAIQYIAEKALEEGVKKASARSGMAVVMVPQTGEVLALAHYPFFNPNTFSQFKRKSWRNRAATDTFEPGSTLKIFSAAAAIEYGDCTTDTLFFCENGKYRVGEDTIHDTRPHGWLTLENIIKYSSNIGAVKIGETIGSEALYRALIGFGFGEKTGIDCPGETAGSLPSFRRWSKIHTGTISFGHGLSVSAIQLITAVSAIANGGTLMKPYMVQAILDAKGAPVARFGPEPRGRAVSEKTAQSVREMMRKVVEEGGTGVLGAVDGYDACGKTGTAQKIDETGAYAKGSYLASFVGFLPARKPRIAIIVLIDEPQGDHYGGTVAAPIFKKIGQGALNYLDVPPRPETNPLTASAEGREKG